MRRGQRMVEILCAAMVGLSCTPDEYVVDEPAEPVVSANPAPAPAPHRGARRPSPEPLVLLPNLSNLTVAGVESTLTPTFSDTVHRYSVRATEPEGELSVTATAEPGLTIELDGETVESGESTALPNVPPGSEVTIRVTNHEGISNEYALVYLPHEFPALDVTIREPSASTDPIYVALRTRTFYVAKLDENGVPLFYRKEPRDVSDFKKHPGGEISYATLVDDVNWEEVLLNTDLEEVDRVTSVGITGTDHHDFRVRKNGNLILLAYVPAVHDLTEFGGSSEAQLFDGVLQELSPRHEVLFQWSTWDHTSYDDNVTFPKPPPDYSHVNSVFVDADGNWIISVRRYSQVLKIDRSSGEIMWRLGGKANEFTFIDDPFNGFCGQHTASRLENGNLLLFDNGVLCWPDSSERGQLTRVAEYELDEQEKTARLVWTFSHDGIFSGAAGSAQRLPNGNTFIGWGNSKQPIVATEVDPDGNIVFELEGRGPELLARSYRARRFPD